MSRRLVVLSRAGQVLPSAWNMPEQVKMMPWATKFSEMMRRNWAPVSMTSRSLVKRETSQAGFHWQSRVNASMTTQLISTAVRNVSRTRSGLPAPKFCPATAGVEKAMAMAGRKIDCMTRPPTPKPACAAAPKSRITV